MDYVLLAISQFCYVLLRRGCSTYCKCHSKIDGYPNATAKRLLANECYNFRRTEPSLRDKISLVSVIRPFPNENSCIPTHPKIDGLGVDKFSEFPWGYGFPKDSVWKTPNPVFVSSNQNRKSGIPLFRRRPLHSRYFQGTPKVPMNISECKAHQPINQYS